MSNVMIFGASGFLGSALVNYLSKKHKVTAVVRPESDTWRLQTPLDLLLTEPTDNWADLIATYKPETVICAQWNGTEIYSRENSEIQKSNVLHIEEIAQICKREKVKTFIAFGSQAETSKATNLVPEKELQNPASAYGEAKIGLLRNLNKVFKHSQTRFIWARVFSVFGPTEIGQTLIPNLIRAKYSGKPLHIINPNLPWSYLYIEDFNSAIEKLISTEQISGVVNVGNNEFVTIEAICKMVSNGLYTSAQTETLSQEGYFPAINKLLTSGWSPRFSLEESLKISEDGVSKNLLTRKMLS